jgi:hypothetical protein
MTRKILFLFSFVLMTVAASAQVSWIAKGGMNLSSITSSDANMKVGFNVGIGMDYALENLFSLQPSLLFTTKGVTESEGDVKVSINAMYLELPILMAGRIPLNPSMNLVITAGPYLAYGVGGKTTASSGGVDISVDTFGEDGLKRFDAGLAAGVALEFNKLYVGLNGEFGLVNISDGGKNKNRNYYLGVGYKF